MINHLQGGPVLVWAQKKRRRRAHAFLVVDLAAGFGSVEPASGLCGRFVVAHLVAVSAVYAYRCVACRRAVELAAEPAGNGLGGAR